MDELAAEAAPTTDLPSTSNVLSFKLLSENNWKNTHENSDIFLTAIQISIDFCRPKAVFPNRDCKPVPYCSVAPVCGSSGSKAGQDPR